MTWYMGIDIGSLTSKGVLFEDDQWRAHHITPSGNHYAAAADKVRRSLAEQARLGEHAQVHTISTGHGADLIAFSRRHVADASCCAAGMHFTLPAVRSIIDIQAQSCQVIVLDGNGRLLDVALSEKCASVGGGFIDIIANVLQVNPSDVGPISLTSKNPVAFSTGCAVFAESEAVSRVAEGAAGEDILAGVHRMLTEKIAAMARRTGLPAPCAVSGGGGLNEGLIKSLADAGMDVQQPPHPELINAIGAAVLARYENM
jgi:predicted CoA-substrate-specific enzyme activase